MRKAGLDEIYEQAKTNGKIAFLGSDLGYNTMKSFRERFHQQFIMEGISEGHIVGMASGMALEGYTVFVNTISTFLIRRGYEQILLNLAHENLKVRLYANGGGVVYGPLGSSHVSIEDIAIMNAIPNMCIVAPCDSNQMRQLIKQSIDYPGPIYIRVGRGRETIVSSETNFKIGKVSVLQNLGEIVILTTGTLAQCALSVSRKLKERGIIVGVVHVHTIKPLDVQGIVSALSTAKFAICLEEHSSVGGLGSLVCEVIVKSKLNISYKSISFPNVFIDKYGRQEELLGLYGVNEEGVLAAIEEFL